MKEETIVEKALEIFQKETGIVAKWTPAAKNRPDNGLDGEIDLYFNNNKGQHFIVEVKQEIRNRSLPQILEYARQYNHKDKTLMVIAEHIFPNIKKELREQGIAYLETTGNIYVRKDPIFIWIENPKQLERKNKEKPNRAFQKAGLKVIFLFLLDEKFINKPYREIAEETDIALGNLNYIINGLKELKFLAMKNKDQYLLMNKKELLEKWTEEYGEKLKPDLFTGRFRFTNPTNFVDWQFLDLKSDARWGGEPAGDIYTNYLQPETLTLYTNEGRGEIMKHYKMAPDEKGNVLVYKKFWKDRDINAKAVPPLLAYADLINTGTPRCIETAQKIYEQNIRHTIE